MADYMHFSAKRENMRSDYAFTAETRKAAPLILETIYAVEADSNFDAFKLPTDERRRALIRTIEGEGEVYCADQAPLRLGAETVLLIDFNLVRRYKPRLGHWRFWYFEFEVSEELALPIGVPLSINGAAHDEVDARECLAALSTPRVSCAALASAIFATMYERWHAAWEAGSAYRHPSENLILNAVSEMRLHLERRLSIPALAAQIGMSERSFRDAFETVMDSSPKSYFNKLRLEKAAELLRLNRYSITQIADMLGYSSAFYFSRTFRDLFGIPPSTYASALRNGHWRNGGN